MNDDDDDILSTFNLSFHVFESLVFIIYMNDMLLMDACISSACSRSFQNQRVRQKSTGTSQGN